MGKEFKMELLENDYFYVVTNENDHECNYNDVIEDIENEILSALGIKELDKQSCIYIYQDEITGYLSDELENKIIDNQVIKVDAYHEYERQYDVDKFYVINILIINFTAKIVVLEED